MPYDSKTGIYAIKDWIQVPDRVTIPEFMFDYQAKARPSVAGRPWLIDSKTGRTLTYEDCKSRTESVAKAFHSLGLGPDSTVVIFSPNEVDYPISVWAAHRLSAIVSCANPAYLPDELKYQIDIVNEHNPVKILLVHPDSLLRGIDAVNKSKVPTASIVLMCKPDDSTDAKSADLCKNYRTLDDVIAELQSLELPPKRQLSEAESRTKTAFYIFSSGTTGLPKAVRIPHRALVANVLQAAAHWQRAAPFTPYDPKTKKGDVVLGVLPFYHIYGLVVVIHASLYMGTPIVVMNKFTFPTFLDSIQRYKITQLYVVPPMVVALVKNDTSKYDLSSVKSLMAGAAPLTDETASALKRKFPKWTFGQGYGQTETCTIVTLFDPSVPGGFPGGSAGMLVPNIEAKIVSPEGKPLPPGSVGELWSRSPSNAIEYLGNEKSTKETFDSEGFVHTGDECKIDENDWLWIVDRIKELIKVKGFQVAPAELEGHLLEHPDVQDCCVIGIPDERAGERPKAYVQLTPSALSRTKSSSSDAALQQIADSIKKHVADVKVNYKHLAEVEFIEAIPKTPSGKLLRRELRTRHAASVKSKNKL